MKALLDTSVLIASRDGEQLSLPEEITDLAVSVVSVAELAVGVLLATDAEQRSARLDALSAIERTYDPLAVTIEVAHAYARMVAAVKEAGRNPRVMDTLIAATAAANDCMVVTRDPHFDGLPGAIVRRV
jgi:predicted nucleic acid-binding protein